MALRKDIQTVMETQGARMTYHIANCLRSDFWRPHQDDVVSLPGRSHR